MVYEYKRNLSESTLKQAMLYVRHNKMKTLYEII